MFTVSVQRDTIIFQFKRTNPVLQQTFRLKIAKKIVQHINLVRHKKTCQNASNLMLHLHL